MVEAVDFERKLKRLMKRTREYIFVNAAISDELTKIQEKISKATEERNCLIQRLLQRQSLCGSNRKVTEGTGQVQKGSNKGGSQVKKRKANIKKTVQHDGDLEEDEEEDDGAPKKKSRVSNTAISSAPRKASLAPLDNSGRPIFPIELGTLTVYSIGEIVTSPNYHSSECIYPIGYCSTRLYVSIDPGSSTSLYTCKVTDAGDRPKFEILPEDSSHCSFVGLSPDQSHLKLLNYINLMRGAGSVPSVPNGAAFFGLDHPTLQNLIQCFPGARKCSEYNWVKFEVTKEALQLHMEQDPSVNISLL